MSGKKIVMIIAIVLIGVLLAALCIGIIRKVTYKVDHPVATITFEGYDEPVVVELYPEYALNTVKNFITLANNEFYNGLKIHRIEDYVIQGGDPNGDGSGGPTLSAINSEIEKDSDEDTEYAIVGEFKANGYDNPLSHEKGVISMARSDYRSLSPNLTSESYNSGGSQFFICTKFMQSFNGQYAAFGKITSGWDTFDAIANAERKKEVNEETGEETKTSTPENDIIISSITVDTHGKDYGKPETVSPFDYYTWYINQLYRTQY